MNQARPHMLYVCWGYPPCRGGGVYRALATANRFAEQGWKVTVLTADKETFHRFTGADLTLEERIHPDIEIVRVPFEWPILEADLRKWSKSRAQNPKLWSKWRTKRDQIPFPETGYGPWRSTIEKAAEQIHQANKVDLTVATANPHVTFAAAYHLFKKFDVPYVMDYRDAWLLDVFSGDRLHEPNSRAARWERKLVKDAREVWFVNDPILDWHKDLYPEHAGKMHTVANGFDPDLVPSTQDRGAVTDRPLVFGYVGTVSPKVPLGDFVKGWQLAKQQSEDLRDAKVKIHGYLGYYAQPRADMLAIINNAADDQVSYEGPVGKAEIAKAYDEFDVQLLMLGKGRYVTSGKVFEYLATGLPIVSVHDPINAASDVLRGHPLWFPVKDVSDPEAIAEALIEAARAARTADEGIRAKAREFGASYRRDLQMDPRIKALSERVGAVV
ncbi:glycosyltransferase [Kribbella sp. NPDC051620]|uniref:glycosyltransferase n=1 Tax=Kribbella sp. NPDC051620 TaxID=3364120 RepID=UPI0037A3EB9B